MTLDETKSTEGSPLSSQRKKSSAFQDPWSDWQPSWTHAKHAGEKTAHLTPQDYQEEQAPTKNVATQLEKGGETHSSRRRIVDARLWEAMTPAQQEAAICIALGHESANKGLGFAASDWHRIRGSGGSNVSEAQARLAGIYFDWARACQKSKLSHAMIIDVLVLGQSCRKVDKERRLRSGSARQNLMDGLTLYCKMRGWH